MDNDQLMRLSGIDISVVDKSALVDLKTIDINPDASDADRVHQYLEQIKNPYVYRVGDVAVKVRYASNGKPLKDMLLYYLSSLKDNI